MRNTTKFLLLIFGTFLLFSESTALQCYSCGGDVSCSSRWNQMPRTECTAEFSQEVCVKHWNETTGRIIYRNCNIEGYCKDDPHCHECTTDLCNTGQSLILPLLLINALTFLLLRLI